MKNLSVATAAHYQLSSTFLAEGWKVTQTSGAVYGWTSHDVSHTIDGVLYRASEGLQPTAAHSTDTLQVDTLDVTAFLDVSTEAEIAAGIWDGASVVHFEYRTDVLPTALNTDVLIKRVGTLGEITRQNNVFTAEVRGLAHALLTRIGRYYSPVCPWRHAVYNGTTFAASVECGLDLTGRIHTGTVTSVGSNAALDFSASAQAQAAGYFNSGLLASTSGANDGVVREVRRWENQQFSLLRPFPFAVEVGMTFLAVQGDDHTFETCRDVFANLAPVGGGGFGGFSHIPGQAAVYASPIRG